MREIKFRAWHDSGKYFYFGLNEYMVSNEYRQGEMCPSYYNMDYEQYTGLRDKNGKYIYEGDILRGGRLDEACCVEWQDNTGQYVAWGEHYNVYGHRFDQFEVIGNIHENPELIN